MSALMTKEGPAAIRRKGPFRLNPGPFLRELGKYNPRLPLGAVELPPELQEAMHDRLLESQRAGLANGQGQSVEQVEIGEG